MIFSCIQVPLISARVLVPGLVLFVSVTPPPSPLLDRFRIAVPLAVAYCIGLGGAVLGIAYEVRRTIQVAMRRVGRAV